MTWLVVWVIWGCTVRCLMIFPFIPNYQGLYILPIIWIISKLWKHARSRAELEECIRDRCWNSLGDRVQRLHWFASCLIWILDVLTEQICPCRSQSKSTFVTSSRGYKKHPPFIEIAVEIQDEKEGLKIYASTKSFNRNPDASLPKAGGGEAAKKDVTKLQFVWGIIPKVSYMIYEWGVSSICFKSLIRRPGINFWPLGLILSCCDALMGEQTHWWTEAGWGSGSLYLSFSLSLSFYLSIYLSINLSNLSNLIYLI